MITPADSDTTALGHQVALRPDENTITVMVEAEDGSMETFTIVVTQLPAVPSAATLTDLRLADAQVTGFMADVTMYLHTVYDGLNDPADMITVSATSTVDDSPDIAPGDADSDVDGHQVALGVGKTRITVTVTVSGASQDYIVDVTRVAASDATLSALSLGVDGVSLSPDFDPSTTEYTASVDNDVAMTDVDVESDTPTTHTTHTSAVATVIQATNGDLMVGENTIKVVVRAVDGTTNTYTVVVTKAGSDATLTDLTISSGTLAPAFTGPDAETIVYEYTATVESTVTSVTLMATKDATAKDPVITPADSDTTALGHQVALRPDENTITVMVEAEDGSMETFTITVTRTLNSDASLLDLVLEGIGITTPTFNSGTTSYDAGKVARHVDRIKVTATSDHGAHIETMPADADPTMEGHQVDLALGKNDITVMVTSSDGSTSLTYTVTVLRDYGGASLSELELTGVMLTPAFSADVISYAGSVANDVENTTVTAKAVAGAAVVPNAALTEDGDTVMLDPGANTIDVVVTSSDGTARTVYSVSVFRVHMTAQLAELSLGDDVALSPVFAAGTTSYTADVDYSIMQVTVAGTPAAGGSVAVQDADGMVIDDADAVADGHQVNLDLGANTIAVAVTGGDPAVMTTYTVMVNRAASTDATLSDLILSGVALDPVFDPGTTTYTASVANDVADTTVMATPAHADATVDPATALTGTGGQGVELDAGATTIVVTVTAADGTTTMTYTVVVARAVVETVEVEVEVEVPGPTVEVPGPTVEVPGPTVTVPGPTVTRTVTKTVEVPTPAQPNVIGMTGSATATEVDGRVLITRHDGGASLVVDLGGFIRDADLGQTYQVVRRADGAIVRQWVSSNSPLVYQIPWAVVNSAFTVPVGVIGSIPLDDMAGAEGQLVRRFDGGDDRIFSYAMGQWRHVPDIPTFQALGFYWCDVTAADASFFDRISMGAAHPASSTPARMDYPSCSTG